MVGNPERGLSSHLTLGNKKPVSTTWVIGSGSRHLCAAWIAGVAVSSPDGAAVVATRLRHINYVVHNYVERFGHNTLHHRDAS